MSFLKHLTVSTHKSILMKTFTLNWVKATGVFLGALYSHYIHDSHILGAIYILIIFDTVLGVTNAVKTGTLDSSNLFRVLVKCMVYFIMIFTGRVIDTVLPISFASKVIESFLALTECLSILENASKIGIPIPLKLVKVLTQARGDSSDNSEKTKSK